MLEKYRDPFIKGCVDHNINKQYAETLWDDTLLGFANYCFNKSHSLAYSVITYLCAFFKAHYPTEFFTSLMTIRSQVMQPKLWAQKAPQFVSEAKKMGVRVHAPYIQKSKLGFTIEDDEIYFGLNAIKQVGVTACRSIIAARKRGNFKDIWDFLARVNRQKVTTRTFEALVRAGAFDRMGYLRSELLEKTKDIYSFFNNNIEYEERIQNHKIRAAENQKKDARRTEIQKEIKNAKTLIKQMKKEKLNVPAFLQHAADYDKRLRNVRQQIRATGLKPEETLSGKDLQEYNESLTLRKKPELKLKDKPIQPELTRVRAVKISVAELMEQADFIGCYLHDHPAPVLYPDTTRIANAQQGDYLGMAGQITNWKQIKTRKGDDMAFAQMGDGTGLAELIIFPYVYKRLKASGKLPEPRDIVRVRCEVETAGNEDSEENGEIKVIVKDIEVYQSK